jgi:hypothetical protein
MNYRGLSDPGSLWPRGTLQLREPRLAQAGGLTPRAGTVKVGPIRPIRTQVKPVAVRTAPLVPLASLLKMRKPF